jgi:hypothetical protein
MGMFDGAFAEWANNLPPVNKEERERITVEELKREQDLAIKYESDRQSLAMAIDRSDIVAAYKINLSGLSANSSGCGGKRNTVYHALCLKNLKLGRIDRRANSFLCNANPGSYGYIATPEDGISCPRCENITQKYKLKLGHDPILKKLRNQY